VRLYVDNQYSTDCSTITVSGNSVNYTNSAGTNNGAWNAANCGTETDWSSNNFDDSTISASILPAIIITDS